jgi:Glycosyl transferase family 2
VVAFNDEAVRAACLDALAAQCASGQVEIVVVSEAARATGPALRARHPDAIWIEAPEGTTVPRLRAMGLARCRGRIVALLEDDCVVEPPWVEAVRAAHASPDAAIGGVVEPGPYRRAIDWAVYFCEYGRFMRPVRLGQDIVLALAGNHVTYKRDAVAGATGDAAGFVDYFVHDAWRRAGRAMRVEPTMGVRNVNRWALRHVTSVPFHHARAFAARRGQARSLGWRGGMTALAPVLPALKLGRIINDTVSRRRFSGRLLQALPWIVMFVSFWSVGEAVGYLGGPGNSPSRWR